MTGAHPKEYRFGEDMVRASVNADLGGLILAAVDEAYRDRLEEAIVELAHDMFEAGQTEGTINAEVKQTDAYLQGLADAMNLSAGGQE